MKALCWICQKVTEVKVIGGNTVCSQEVTEAEWERGLLYSAHLRARVVTRCPKCSTKLICPVCTAAERGSVKSEAKTKAARENGKLGGRPRHPQRQALSREKEGRDG